MARTATTTSNFSLSSSNLTSSALNISASTQLKRAGSKLGLIDTTGLAIKTTESSSEYTLFTASEFTADLAHKVYLKNLSEIATEYFLIKINTVEMGRLYAGDFTFFPWSAATSADIKITPSVATSMSLEHMLIHE